MMSNEEMLMAMSNLLDVKLAPMQADIRELKSDVKELRSDVDGLKADVKELRSDVDGLKADVEELRSDMDIVKTKVDTLTIEMADTRKRLQRLELLYETQMIPKMNILAENYVPAAQRFLVVAESIEHMQSDIHIMKKVIREHSKALEQLA